MDKRSFAVHGPRVVFGAYMITSSRFDSLIRLALSPAALFGLGALAPAIVGFALIPIYARVLGPEALGVAEIGLVSITLGSRGFVAGLDATIAIRLNEVDSRIRVVTGTALGAAINCGLAFAGVTITLFVLEPLGSINAATSVLVGAGTAVLVLFVIGNATLRHLALAESYLRTAIVFVIVTVTIGITGAIGGLGSTAPILAVVTGYVAASVVAWMSVRESIGRPLPWSEMAAQLRLGFPLVPASLATTAMFAIDRYVVGAALGATDVGLYAAGSRVAQGLALISSATLITWFPFVMRRHRDIDAQGVIRHGIGAIAWLGAFAIVVAALLRQPLVDVIAGAEFSSGSAVVWPLTAGAVFYTLYQMAMPGMMIGRRTGRLAVIALLATSLAAAVSVALVPQIGIQGAAFGTAAGSGTLFLMTFAIGQRTHRLPFRAKDVIFPGVVAVVAALMVTSAGGYIGSVGGIAAAILFACRAGLEVRRARASRPRRSTAPR